MPWYDLKRSTVTNAAAGSESTHMAGKALAPCETVSVMNMYAAARMGNAGGNILRLKTNTAGGTVFSGGTAQVPTPKNPRMPAAQSTWVDDTSAITIGTTLLLRGMAGFAATGGQGGLVPLVPGDAVKMVAGAAASNPVDIELTSIASQVSVNFDMSLDILEGSD